MADLRRAVKAKGSGQFLKNKKERVAAVKADVRHAFHIFKSGLHRDDETFSLLSLPTC